MSIVTSMTNKKKFRIKISMLLTIFFTFSITLIITFLVISLDYDGMVKKSKHNINSKDNNDDVTIFKRVEVTTAQTITNDNLDKSSIHDNVTYVNTNKPYWPIHQYDKYNMQFKLHFIHVPKCGGTTMTSILRQMMCDMNSTANVDCCTNPGFCDHRANRKCAAIRGCINHIPNRYCN